jgi:hypothetical protein
MAREQNPGRCEHCRANFTWYLVHNGFNNSCHAYCSDCRITAILSLYSPQLRNSQAAGIGEIATELEPLLKPCSCGGHFVSGSSPKCPVCMKTLSAEHAATYIEASSPGAQIGWRWQGAWNGIWALYCIVINNRVVHDVFSR